MNKEQLKEFSKCDGKHKNLNELFDCKSCAVLFDDEQIKRRLEYLRKQIDAERISYSEIAELQSLAEYIDDCDVQLLEWARVPEFLGSEEK